MRVPIAAVAVLAVTAGLTSCTSAPQPGPLGFGGSDVTSCAPVEPGAKILFGEVISAPPAFDVTVSSVELVGASGVTLDAAQVMPIVDLNSIGSSEYPPTNPPAGWDQRVPAEGAVVTAGTDANVLVVLTRTGADVGKVGALRVTYTAEYQSYSKTGTTRYVLADAC